MFLEQNVAGFNFLCIWKCEIIKLHLKWNCSEKKDGIKENRFLIDYLKCLLISCLMFLHSWKFQLAA